MALNKKSWLLIIINTIHAIINLFYSTFLVAYFLNITKNNIIPSSLFYIFTFILVIIGFPAIGPLIKKGNKLFLYRMSFLVGFILLLLIIWLKENIVHYVWILGFVFGIEKIFYWFPQNVLISETANKNQLVKYTGYSMFFWGMAKIITPVILGYFISLNSFINTAVFILGLSIILFILSFLLKDTKFQTKKFNLKALLVLATRHNKIKTVLKVEFLKGITLDIIDTLIILYIVYMFKTNLNLGIFTSLFAICSVATNFILGYRCSFKSFRIILLIANIFLFSATAYFVFDTSKFTFIIYNLIFATAGETVRTITEINMYKMSQDKSVVVHYRAEYIALREIVLNLGRIIGFTMVILVALSNHEMLLKYLILLLSIILAYVGYLSVILIKSNLLKKARISLS